MPRTAWSGVAGLAVSQILAAWLGQGAYYATLIVAGYIAYRTLLVPPSAASPGLDRPMRLLQHSMAVLLFGTGLAAAGLLPRIEFNALSDLAGGYAGADLMVGGLRPEQWVFLVEPGFWYVGVSVLALAAAAPLLVRARVGGAIWYFVLTSLVALVLTDTFQTPLGWLLYHLLPGFARLHPHAPERVLTVAYLGPALLAGATVSAVGDRHRSRGPALIVALVVVLVAMDLGIGGSKARGDRMPLDPLGDVEALSSVDLSTYYLPDGVARFLRDRLAESPSRYLGYAQSIGGRPRPYTLRFLDPSTTALAVNNRALPLGLQDVQGYDASHLRRYDVFLAAHNGLIQDYHDADVFRSGLASPLANLLTVRYMVVPAVSHLDPDDAATLQRYPRPVYEDQHVRIVENTAAFPRAWIVHAAAQVDPDEALRLIGTGQADARRTAFIEETPPPLEQPFVRPGQRDQQSG